MLNQEKLKKYLLGTEDKEGYLKSELSNGKVIMLSGKWGSGKTYFWQNIIATEKFKEELKEENKAYHYISLYGKKSIDEIENELFLKVYSSVGGIDEKISKVYTNISFIAKKLTKTSKNLAELIDKFKDDYEKNYAEDFLLNGGIICFDDFERKSKEIDLNDLFGFITQLTLNFNCKVVIILNDDVFKDQEKKIFSNVKEKTISKFLYYNPMIEELFNSVFDKHNINNFDNRLRETTKDVFVETNILNARIYIQVLDNLLEWLKEKGILDEKEIRCFIISNVFFILYHTIFDLNNDKYDIKRFNDKLVRYSKDYNSIQVQSFSMSSFSVDDDRFKAYASFEAYFNKLEETISKVDNKHLHSFLLENKEKYKSMFFINELKPAKDIEHSLYKKINNFIETGILED